MQMDKEKWWQKKIEKPHKKMPKLLEPVDRISLDQLSEKLNTLEESTVGE